jgi:hypothetical protein
MSYVRCMGTWDEWEGWEGYGTDVTQVPDLTHVAF